MIIHLSIPPIALLEQRIQTWYSEVDLLKATALVLIVLCHLDDFIASTDLFGTINGYEALMGLSLFFFVSGVLLSRHDEAIRSVDLLRTFWRKRFIRIYPL